MLYGIETRLAAAVVLLPLFCFTYLVAQEPSAENFNIDTTQKRVSGLISLSHEASGAETDSSAFSDLSSVKPDDAIGFNNLGVNLAKIRRYDEAIKVLQRAIEIDPRFRSAYINLCNVYDMADRPEEALEALRKAVELSPFSPAERGKECELLLLVERNQESVNCYTNLGKTAPLDATSQVNLGVGFMRLEKWSEADRFMEPVEPQMQYNPRYFNALGMIRYHTKHYKAAVEAFKQAVELDPERKDARFNLALAQLAIQNKPGALSQYRFLSESDPELAQELYRIIYRDKLVFVDSK
jgi:superkiller protein 3